MKTYKIGIIGCGNIAKKMALTLGGMKHVERHAVASRSKEKAETFAGEWQFTKAYGSYEELIKDPHVDLIYIATPHSEHYEHARLCILNQKPVLCEKAFTANARQAEELLNLAKEHQVFITEAIWTRYMPLSQKIRELIEQGAIGKPYTLSANLGYVIQDKERIIRRNWRRSFAGHRGLYPQFRGHDVWYGHRRHEFCLPQDRDRSRRTGKHYPLL